MPNKLLDKHPEENEESRKAMLLRYGKTVLVGAVVAFAADIALMLLFAFGPRSIVENIGIYPLTVIISVLGSLAGGMFALRNNPPHRLLVGLSGGVVLTLLQMVLGLLLNGHISLAGSGIGIVFGNLCGGALASVLSGGRKAESKVNH